MSEFGTLLDREAREFDLPPDLRDRTRRVVTRRQRRRKISVLVVSLIVTTGGFGAAWLAFTPTHRATSHEVVGGSGPTGATSSPGPLIGKIVIAGGQQAVPQLMTWDPGASEGQIVAPSPYPQWDPAVSPDGTKIAYRGYFGPEEGDYDLYVMNADGSGITRITHDALATSPAWSPDGSLIAFGAAGLDAVPGQFVGRTLIELINPDGSLLHPLTVPPEGAEDSSPTWSPDGTRLAFVRLTPQDGFQIYTIGADGTGASQLTVTPGHKSHPAWSPDGRTIVFSESPHEGGASQIYSVDAAGGTPTQLTEGASSCTNPLWIEGGARIAYACQEGAELRTMDPDGSDVEKVSGPRFVAAFDWRTS
jgi:Tol biopolymer transport system component